MAFNLASATTIDSILTSIQGTGSFSLQIVAEAAGSPTGTVFYSTTLIDPTASTLLGGLSVSLAAGHCWRASHASVLGAGGGWSGGGATASQPWSFTSGNNNDWFVTGPGDAPATRITAVPEPGTWALMLGGVALLGWLVRRRLARCRAQRSAELNVLRWRQALSKARSAGRTACLAARTVPGGCGQLRSLAADQPPAGACRRAGLVGQLVAKPGALGIQRSGRAPHPDGVE